MFVHTVIQNENCFMKKKKKITEQVSGLKYLGSTVP